jgi:alpha-L-fucosidase
VHVHALDPSTGTLRLPTELQGGVARWIDGSMAELDAGLVRIPEGLRGDAVATLTVQR